MTMFWKIILRHIQHSHPRLDHTKLNAMFINKLLTICGGLEIGTVGNSYQTTKLTKHLIQK